MGDEHLGRQAGEVGLKHNARRAEAALDKPDLSKALLGAEIGQLARALAQKIGALPWSELQGLRADPGGETAQYLIEAQQALAELTTSFGLVDDGQ